jgi:small subunit ribosomal protein S17
MADEISPEAEESATPPETGAQNEGEAVEGSGPSEPAEVLAPKERKRRARQAKQGTRRPGTPEERAAERARKRELRRQTRARLREKRRREPSTLKGETGTAAETVARSKSEGRQKTRQGVVVSDRAAKTITVRIDTAHRHRRYEKIVRTSSTVHAHDEQGDAHIGDTVIVRECRPLSRTKRWRLERVVERAG